MQVQDIERLVRRLGTSPIEEIDLDREGKRLILRSPGESKGSRAHGKDTGDDFAQGRNASLPNPAGDCIRAPAAGVFYASHPLAADPSGQSHAEVQAGWPVGYLCVGSVLSAVNTTARGRLAEQLVRDGTLVGCGESLFRFVAAT